jgi:hypothetical protein
MEVGVGIGVSTGGRAVGVIADVWQAASISISGIIGSKAIRPIIVSFLEYNDVILSQVGQFPYRGAAIGPWETAGPLAANRRGNQLIMII